jgi:hypothetical protein
MPTVSAAPQQQQPAGGGGFFGSLFRVFVGDVDDEVVEEQ